MQFFCSAVNINQEKVVQQKILYKVVLIKSFFIGHKKILYLECNHLAYHINIFSGTAGNQNIFKLLLIVYFKILKSLYLL